MIAALASFPTWAGAITAVCDKTSSNRARSRPAFSPRTTASAIACMPTPSSVLTTNFIAVPEPEPPRRKYRFAIAWNIGSAAPNTSRSPPTSSVRMPASAAGVLPEMATSSTSMPPLAPSLCRSRELSGEIVLISSTTVPDRAPAKTPSGPVKTLRTASSSVKQERSTSALRASSRMFFATTPPCAAMASALARSMSYTERWYP